MLHEYCIVYFLVYMRSVRTGACTILCCTEYCIDSVLPSVHAQCANRRVCHLFGCAAVSSECYATGHFAWRDP
jgi:hypothetical protein